MEVESDLDSDGFTEWVCSSLEESDRWLLPNTGLLR
jgi:hypothetical protein